MSQSTRGRDQAARSRTGRSVAGLMARGVALGSLAMVGAVIPVVGTGGVAASTVAQAPVRLASPAFRSGSASTSTNWSGYASTAGPFTSVSSSWTQPAGTCTKKTSYSSFWVGLDGDGSNSVEQTGSEVDCSKGIPAYYAWYEMYPKAPVNFVDTVEPGDIFVASVTEAAGGNFTLTIADTTQGWSHVVQATYAKAQLYSAEIIAEAPSSGSRILPLTDFGTIAFTASEANGEPIGSVGGTAITMKKGATVKAAPGALSAGEDFTVTWHHR